MRNLRLALIDCTAEEITISTYLAVACRSTRKFVYSSSKGCNKNAIFNSDKKKAFFQLILNVNVILYVEFIRKSILAKSRIEKNIIGISQ